MSYTRNSLDGIRVYFENDETRGTAETLYGGLLDSIGLLVIYDFEFNNGVV